MSDKNPSRLKPIKVDQTSIQIYQTARGEYQFRYYLVGKAHQITRSSWEKFMEKATKVATSIENGCIRVGPSDVYRSLI